MTKLQLARALRYDENEILDILKRYFTLGSYDMITTYRH